MKKKLFKKIGVITCLAFSGLSLTSCSDLLSGTPFSWITYTFFPRTWFLQVNRLKDNCDKSWRDDFENGNWTINNNDETIEDILEDNIIVYEKSYWNRLVSSKYYNAYRTNLIQYKSYSDYAQALKSGAVLTEFYREKDIKYTHNNTIPDDKQESIEQQKQYKGITFVKGKEIKDILNHENSKYVIELANKEQEYYAQKYDLNTWNDKNYTYSNSELNGLKKKMNDNIWTSGFGEVADKQYTFRNFSLKDAMSEKGTEVGTYDRLYFKSKKDMIIKSISFDLTAHWYKDRELCYERGTIHGEGENEVVKYSNLTVSLGFDYFMTGEEDYFMDFTGKNYNVSWIKRNRVKKSGGGQMEYDFARNSRWTNKTGINGSYWLKNQTYQIQYENNEIKKNYYMKDDETYNFSIVGRDYSIEENRKYEDVSVALENEYFFIAFDFSNDQDGMIYNISNFKIDYDVIDLQRSF